MLSPLRTPTSSHGKSIVQAAFSFGKKIPPSSSPTKKTTRWVTLEDGTLTEVKESSDSTTTTHPTTVIEMDGVNLQEDEEIRFYSNDSSLREIDVDYGTYIIEYTGLKHIYNITTSDCSKTPTTKIFINEEKNTEPNGTKFTGFFKIGPREIRKGKPISKNKYKNAEPCIQTCITFISGDKRIDSFRKHMTIGDILVELNGSSIVDQAFVDVANNIKELVQSKRTRKFKVLNQRKCTLDVYLRNLELRERVQQDSLGFNCSVEYLLDEKALMNMHSAATLQRDLEWVDYLKAIGGPENLKPAGIFKPSDDLKVMVRRGVPVAYRSLVWQKLSLSSLHRLQFPTDYYQSLLLRVGELSSKVRDDIEKDVDRTFPEHAYFSSAGKGEVGLRRILQAFAVHNPEVGYCQSLNFVAGMMLIFMQEEDAFWLLVTVVEKLLPNDYYTQSMVGTYVDQFVLAHIIKRHLPNIHKTLDKNQLQLPLITVQWFMCIFVNTLRPEVTLRIWDMFFNEGSKVLFRIAGALFKLHEKELVAVKDAADLFSALRSIGKDVVDADKLISVAYKRCNFRVKPALHSSRSAKGISRSASDGNHTAAVTKPGHTSSSSQPHNPQSGISSIGSGSGRQLISPRLRTNQGLGAVPDVLVGIGLAHVGPRVASTPSSDSINFHVSSPRMSEGGEEEKIALQRANSWSIGRPPIEASSAVDFSLKATVSADRISFSGRPISITKATKPDPLRLSVNADYRYSEKERESIVAADLRLSAEYLSAQKFKNRGKKILPTINGELNFYRADIAVWRRSFRPALEERHSRMEVARKLWREQLNSNENGESRSGSPTPVVNSDVDEENATLEPNGIKEERPEHEQENEGGSGRRASPIANMTSIDPHRHSGDEALNSDSSTIVTTGHNEQRGDGAAAVGGGILGSLLRGRRSFTPTERGFPSRSSLSPGSQVKNLDFSGAFNADLSDVLNSTYNLDHEFERISDKNITEK